MIKNMNDLKIQCELEMKKLNVTFLISNMTKKKTRT